MEQKRLPVRTKLGFGICDLGGNLFFTMMGFYLLNFMTDTIKLGAALAGTALAIGKVWDAVTDPAVGMISDRTSSRWGRRRPYMFVGAIFLFLFMIVMFVNPHIGSQLWLFVWAVLAFCLLNTAYTLVNIPYSALTPELTDDFNERTSLNGYRMMSAVIGTLLAVLALPIVHLFANPDIGWPAMGGIMGLIMMLAAMTTVFSIREPKGKPATTSTNVLRTYGAVLKQKPFLLALFPWTLHITGVTVIQASIVYYFHYIYGNEQAFQFALLFLLISALIFIPVWVQISKRIGKKLSYNIGMGIFSAVILIFFLFGEKLGVTFAYVVMAISGVGFATHYVMPWSIIPDVVENDYADNGTRREGVFYGMWTFMSKVGQALALALSGWILSAVGYVPDAAQNTASLLGIRLLCGPVPVAFFIGGIVILSFYPINKAFYEKIVAKVRMRETG